MKNNSYLNEEQIENALFETVIESDSKDSMLNFEKQLPVDCYTHIEKGEIVIETTNHQECENWCQAH
jgi:hypothetical protein